MREVPVTSMGAVAPDVLARLREELRTLRTLGDVLAWTRRQQPPRTVTEIVTQDEYTHDVVFDLDGATYLAFDTT